MEPRYLLDTNICIYIRQKRPEVPQAPSRGSGAFGYYLRRAALWRS